MGNTEYSRLLSQPIQIWLGNEENFEWNVLSVFSIRVSFTGGIKEGYAFNIKLNPI